MEKYKLQVQAIAKESQIAMPEWQGLSGLLPLLERVRTDGCSVVLKMSGENSAAQPYMALFLGGPLKEDFVRVVNGRLDEAVGLAIINYARRFWGFNG